MENIILCGCSGCGEIGEIFKRFSYYSILLIKESYLANKLCHVECVLINVNSKLQT